jgi:hypothetical protein
LLGAIAGIACGALALLPVSRLVILTGRSVSALSSDLSFTLIAAL